nr:hypothetical protein GCM10023233_00160 [Brevibacterium otitidis]BFF08582.1 hypothetical protein GCM10023233_35510 [Brevibacterium otitidis]
MSVSVLVEHVTHVLGALVGDFDTDVVLVRSERRFESRTLPVGEAFAAGPQKVADAVERVSFASPVPECLLLDAPADVINSAGGELHDVKSIEHTGGVVELVIDRVFVSLERVQRRDPHTLAEGRPACGEPVLVHRC